MTAPLDLSPVLFSPDFEGTEPLVVTEGRIPRDLKGTYYLNGPGHFQFGSFRYRHWLDGDGYLRALHLKDGTATLTAKFIRTKKFLAEAESGKPLFRAFGTSFEGDQLRLRMAIETPANVSCWPFGGRLLAFGEQAPPWEIEKGSLDVVGECHFQKTLNAITPFSAHPKIDRKKRRLCNFGIKYMADQARLCYWEFDEDLACRSRMEFPLSHSYSVHDYMVSENHVALHLSPYYLNSGAVIRDGLNIHDALDWIPEDPNRLLIFSRNGKLKEPVEIDIGRRGYCLHTIEATETGNTLVLDVLETSEPLYLQYLPLPALFEAIKPCRFVRLEIDMATWTVRNTSFFEPGCHLDFPTTLEKAFGSQHVWALGMPVEPVGQSKYYDRILRYERDSGTMGDSYHSPLGSYLSGEPAIAEMDADNTYLICPEWNSGTNTCAYLVFNPLQLAQGPIARLQSAHPGNLGFHSSFDPA